MLKHASRSRHIDPGRPPAAAGGLRSQVPDLVHGPRELLDCRQLHAAAEQAGRRERTRFFDRRSRAGIVRLGSFSYHTGPPEPQLTSSGRATRPEWLSSTHQTKCHDVGGAGTHFCFIYGRMAAGCKYTFSDVSIWTNGCAQRARRPHISLIL